MKDLTKGHEGKQILLFTLPMLIGSVFQQLYNTADSIIVGQFIGKEAMAAVSVANPIMFLLNSFVIGISLGFSILVSQYYGGGKLKKVKDTINTSYIIIFIASIIITVLGIGFSSMVLKLMSTPQEVFQGAKIYLIIIFIGTLFSAGYNCITAILRGLGDTKNPLLFLIIATIINIILDVIFIINFGMGVEGAALATILAQGISFIFSIIYLNKKHDLLRFSIKKLCFDKIIFSKALKLGIPSAIQQMLFSFGNIAMQSLVNSFGSSAMAAFGAGAKIESFISLPIMNLGAAVSTFVAQNIGARKLDRIKKGIKYTNLIALSLAGFVVTLFFVLGEKLIMIFSGDIEVVNIGTVYLKTIGPFFLVISVSFIYNSAIKGAGKAMFPLISSMVSLWIARIPAAYICAKIFGVNGIWMGIPLGWIIGFIITYIYYKRGKWLESINIG